MSVRGSILKNSVNSSADFKEPLLNVTVDAPPFDSQTANAPSPSVSRKSSRDSSSLLQDIHPALLGKVRFEESKFGSTRKKLTEATLFGKCVAEFIGTLMLVLFGVGVVNASVLQGDHTAGIWQVAITWGFAIAFAIIVSAQTSGAHLNPAVTITLALLREFDTTEAFAYIGTQFFAAFIGGCINYSIFAPLYSQFEDINDVSGDFCVRSAMVFGTYYPNPGFYPDWTDHFQTVTTGRAFYIEAFATGILMFMIFTVTDVKNDNVSKPMVPWLIGFTVTVLIALYAPFTQVTLNPARDFGPRLVSLLVSMQWCDPRNGFWVYLFAPVIGAILGGLVYDYSIGMALPKPIKDRRSFCATPRKKY